jgi:hypothetical protein
VIHCRIQAHPSRVGLHDRLRGALSPLPCEVMVHESQPPDPWAGYKRCLDYEGDAEHLLIVQDDCLPATGFAAATEKIASANPNTPVCLFMGAFPAATAGRVRRAGPSVRYVPLGPSSFVPLVCVLWPSHVARQFLDWSTTARGMTRADDGNAARWVRATKQQIVVAVPSIVQHDDDQPSVKGGRDHKPWAEGWRRALLLADDATAYEW